MAELVTLNLEAVQERVIAVLREFPAVVAVYLFGSALGACRPDSDLDLGLLIQPADDARQSEALADRMATRLGHFHGHPFDVLVLNFLDSILAFRIVKSGKLLYAQDQLAVSDFIEMVSRRYGENYPRYREAIRAIVGV